MSKASAPLKDRIRKHKTIIFPLLAFIVPLLVRTIPEILMGPYVLGFDTLAFYIPSTLLWLHNGLNLWNFLESAPLFSAIYVPLVGAGGSPVFLIKIISPLLLGFLALSMYAFARRCLSWSPTKSMFVAVLGTIYFVALRASWDQLREELSLVFFFIALLLLINEKDRSWKRYTLLSLAMLAVVLSDQIGAVVTLGVVIFTIVFTLFHRRYIEAINLIVASLSAALYFGIVYFNYISKSGLGSSNVVAALANWTGFASYQSMLISEAGFFLYCFIPLLPLVMISFKQFSNFQLRSWLLFSLILLLLPITSVSPYRWILMLVYPLAFYATETLSRLKTIKWKRFRFTLQRIAVLYLILSTLILSFGFVFMTPEQPFAYFNPGQFNAFINQIPSSMLQNTIPITDCQNTVNALQWFKDDVNSSALLLTHAAFYGWALLTLNQNHVINYGFENPVNAASKVAQEGYTQIYIIWWINGQGWYGQSTLTPAFHEVYQNGKIAIYRYNSTL